MRRIIIVFVVLAAAGGWYWFKHHQPSQSEEDIFNTQVNAVPVAPLPPEAKKILDEADALWSQTGGDLASPSAPKLAALYSQVLDAMYNLPGNHDAEVTLLRDRLTPLGNALFFTKTRWPDDPSGLIGTHVVVPGEGPDAIGKAHGLSREMVNRLRAKDINDSNLRVGEILKVVNIKEKGGYRIHIDLSDYTLDLWIGGVFAKRYIISHGAADSPTPVGRTHLTDRVWHPSWTHPKTKKLLPYGDPENILGPVWLPFDAKELGVSGIGIHGYTGADGRMMAQVSNGCIRMENKDAEEVYQLIASPGRAPTSVDLVR